MKYIRRFIFLLHLVFLAGLYLVYSNDYFTPNQSIIPSFVALFFLYACVVHLIFSLAWLAGYWKYGVLIFVLSAGLYFPINNWIRIEKGEITAVAKNLKVISYNVHYLPDPNIVNEFFEHEDADVMLLQEVYEKNLPQISRYKARVMHKVSYPYITIISKHPIVRSQEILDRTTNGHVAYADIAIDGIDTIRFITTYLEPMYLDQNSFNDALSEERYKEGNAYIKNQLTRGKQIHVKQLNQIEPFVTSSPYPVVLGGDLNAVPNSYEYNFLKNKLKDVYPWSDRVFAPTFFIKGFPIRLDYFFVSEGLYPTKLRTPPMEASDHYPIILELGYD